MTPAYVHLLKQISPALLKAKLAPISDQPYLMCALLSASANKLKSDAVSIKLSSVRVLLL